MRTTAAKPTAPTNVAFCCHLRGNCREGLRGLKLRHAPTGRPFVAGGSSWGAGGELLIYMGEPARPTLAEYALQMARRHGAGTPAYERAIGSYGRTLAGLPGLLTVCAADLPDATPVERLDARGCELLEPWPVRCCHPAPSRARVVPDEGLRPAGGRTLP